VLSCVEDLILQEFYTLFLTRLRTYKIALPPQTNMTGKADIKGLVYLSSFVHASSYQRWASTQASQLTGPRRSNTLHSIERMNCIF
jgi:hypothetical protein